MVVKLIFNRLVPLKLTTCWLPAANAARLTLILVYGVLATLPAVILVALLPVPLLSAQNVRLLFVVTVRVLLSLASSHNWQVGIPLVGENTSLVPLPVVAANE